MWGNTLGLFGGGDVVDTLANLVKSNRLAVDMSQEQFAHECGMSAANLSRIESGAYRHPKRRTVLNIVEALARLRAWSPEKKRAETNRFLRAAGYATDEEVRILPLDALLESIGSLGAIGAIEYVLREHFNWPPDRVAPVTKAAEIYHPSLPQPDRAA